MRIPSDTSGRNVFARLALIGLVSGTVAGCSSDTSRFAADSPSPGYGAAASHAPAPEVTGSLGAAPTGRVDLAPLPPPGQASGAPPSSYAASGPSQPLYGAPAYASAQPAAAAPPPATAASRPATAGTHVVVAGETLSSISRMYGVSVAALGTANGIEAGKTVRTGQTLIIPPGGNGASQARGPATAATAAKPTQVAATPGPVGSLGTLPASAKPAPAMAAAKPQTTSPVVAQAAPTPAVAKGAAPAPTQAVAKPAEAKVETAAKVSVAEDADDGPRPAGGGPQFRAPVRGRVVGTFGPKPGGARNDGVNFAVPEGTSVRAAEDGVVAYAGNELKDYGNLVLIKHSDGYVTAYAHNSELTVKRGDTVRRGQIIAKAGQSGGVTSPQLHFEIRKGSQPVDPGRYVAGL